MADADWYRGGFFDVYSRDLGLRVPPERTAVEVDWLMERLELAPGSKVLDVCCGTGRHTVEFARRGVVVTGVDLNDTALDLARERAAEAGVSPEFVKADMRELDFAAGFDAAVNLLTAFGYLESEEEDERAMAAMGRALRPGGRLAIDTVSILGIAGRFGTRRYEELPEGGRLLMANHYEPLTGKVVGEWVLVKPDGEEVLMPHGERLYTPVELARMARRAGLEPDGLAADLTGGEWSLASQRLVFVARRGEDQ